MYVYFSTSHCAYKNFLMLSIHQKPDMNLECKKTMDDLRIKVDLWKLVDILTKLYGGRKLIAFTVRIILHGCNCVIPRYCSGIENISKKKMESVQEFLLWYIVATRSLVHLNRKILDEQQLPNNFPSRIQMWSIWRIIKINDRRIRNFKFYQKNLYR